jgi:hypothetical protein
MITDADWAEANKLRRAYESGGNEALKRAYEELCKDPIRWVRVMSAFHSDYVRAKVDAFAALAFFLHEATFDLVPRGMKAATLNGARMDGHRWGKSS